MTKFFYLLFQVLILIILFLWIMSFEQRVDFFWEGIIFTSKISSIIFISVFLIVLILIIYRIYIFFRQSPKKIRNSMVINNYNKGITSIVKAIAAMSNNDDKELIVQANRIDNYLKDNPISLILKAESAKKAKKNDIAEKYYNQMLQLSDTKIIGFRGLLEQNLKKQDFHHALIYAEEIYKINYKLEWIFETIIQIIVKTQNWQKLIEINKDAYYKKIISKKEFQETNSSANYEIAIIKESFSSQEAINLLSIANNDRPNYPPIVKKFSSLLINNNEFTKAKKLILKCWANFPHQMLFDEYVNISRNENTNIINNVSKLIKNNPNEYDSIIAMAKAHILEKNWERAKNLMKPLLSSKPSKTVCEVMHDIELGMSGNAQKANSWKNRILMGDYEKTWVCKYTGYIQDNWSPVSEGGFLNSLEWTWPKTDKIKEKNNLIPNIIGSS